MRSMGILPMFPVCRHGTPSLATRLIFYSKVNTAGKRVGFEATDLAAAALDLLDQIAENKMVKRQEDVPVGPPPQALGLIVGVDG